MCDTRKATDSSRHSTYHYTLPENVCYEQSYGTAHYFEHSKIARRPTRMLATHRHPDQLTMLSTRKPAIFRRQSHVESDSQVKAEARQHWPIQIVQRQIQPPSHSLSETPNYYSQLKTNATQRRSPSTNSYDHSTTITIAR